MKKSKKTNSKNSTLKKVNDNSIIRKIFKILSYEKGLEIIRYNKDFQKKLNLKIIDYKRTFSKIEIEIIPAENKFGKFINYTKANEKNFHIFFNDDEKEIKSQDFCKSDKVKKNKDNNRL